MFYFWSSYDGPGTKVFSLFKLLNRFYFLKGNVFCWWSENWFNMSVVPCFCVISTGQNYHRKLLYISCYDSGSTTERYSYVNKTIEGITETLYTAIYREYQPPLPPQKNLVSSWVYFWNCAFVYLSNFEKICNANFSLKAFCRPFKVRGVASQSKAPCSLWTTLCDHWWRLGKGPHSGWLSEAYKKLWSAKDMK